MCSWKTFADFVDPLPVKKTNVRGKALGFAARAVSKSCKDHVGECTDKRQPRTFIKKRRLESCSNTLLSRRPHKISFAAWWCDMTTDCKSGLDFGAARITSSYMSHKTTSLNVLAASPKLSEPQAQTSKDAKYSATEADRHPESKVLHRP